MRTILTLVLALCTLGMPLQADPGFLGNKEAKIYHLPTCKLVLKIKPENKVPFATKEEAVQAGYAPCKICIK